jgi:hypothetical protein
LLQHLLDRALRRDRENRVADGLERGFKRLWHGSTIARRPARARYRVGWMPRHWFWMQIVIIVLVLASIVIAITKLA